MPAALRRYAMVIVAVTGIGLSTTLSSSAGPGAAPADSAALAVEAGRSAADGPASRGRARKPADAAVTPPSTKAAPTPTTAAPTPAAEPAASPSPSVPAPVGGLTQAEMNNAVAIIDVARQLNLPRRAAVVGIATALQESHLRNLANPNLPQSLQRPNEGVGYDYDSVGLFQQRPSWGTVDQLMDPRESARRFYAALSRVEGWEQLAVTVAAQTVQRSAFPDAYAKWEGLAQQIVDAVM
ncbi:hypothetical protein Daura_40405 [Dactylosporangium aurantiacum]|uniref:Secreted protein n=1 Tax=Dactylosporangium aurantiacum TaxID=35754 RepID=A0A9Q9IF05_9ACTN|nr:hypothetical protein [Dactylosporangium aurantiacum]MDG6102956.1 hypothetical protein [Dactylosporangium aurantiacum]UWZ52822.1 hypothetical protein Daura_40405 [Dactylosporangium aurantiacum]